jgi:hypothetical protein
MLEPRRLSISGLPWLIAGTALAYLLLLPSETRTYIVWAKL